MTTSERHRNAFRVKAAGSALKRHAWQKGEDPEDASLIDVLADLRHYCDAYGLGFADADRLAHQHYLAELVLPVGDD